MASINDTWNLYNELKEKGFEMNNVEIRVILDDCFKVAMKQPKLGITGNELSLREFQEKTFTK